MDLPFQPLKNLSHTSPADAKISGDVGPAFCKSSVQKALVHQSQRQRISLNSYGRCLCRTGRNRGDPGGELDYLSSS